MGTSSSQRSPATPEWERVRELYALGARDPSEVARRIVAALSPDVVTQMAGPGVATCVDTLLQAAAVGSDTMAAGLGLPTGHSTAATIRAVAERRIATAGRASRFSDIALDALGACAVEVLTPSEARSNLPPAGPRLLGSFMAGDMERCFRYFVSRDISEFVGLPALPDVAAAEATVRRIADRCRAVMSAIDYVPLVPSLPPYTDLDGAAGERRVQQLLFPLERMVHTGLEAIATGPSERP